MTAVRSCLARIVPSAPTSSEGLEALRQRAWAEQGVVVLNVEEVTDDWLRQALKNEAAKRWGRRMKR
ncbi:MAG: hypothetical protein J0H39_13905 [Alphaproteobacteria bacterium]|nr:hypothetical protein [Alphaproteobacteria bacterium]